MSDEGKEPCSLGSAKVVNTTVEALKVMVGKGMKSKTFWVPRSVVSDGSDIEAAATKDDEGELFVATWWAEKEGHA